VFHIVRLRLADGSPLSLESARFPAARAPRLLEYPLGGSIYDLLESEFDARPAHSEERIEVALASADEARILGVAERAPLLLVERLAWTDSGTPIEFALDLFRGDRTTIRVRADEPEENRTARRNSTHTFEIKASADAPRRSR